MESTRIAKRFCGLILLIQLAVFVWMLMQPVYWQEGEITVHDFFWSMNGIKSVYFLIDDKMASDHKPGVREIRQLLQEGAASAKERQNFVLHTGLRAVDFLKPFMPLEVDGIFRFRQVSYLTQMLFFKLSQSLGIISFKNVPQIVLHILNTVLLFYLLLRLTGSRAGALFGALTFFNSGVALATLMFPFRNAKILVLTFFLLAWLIVARSGKSFAEISWKRRAAFFAITILGLLTDEYGFILFPGLFLYLMLRDGWKPLFHRRVLLEGGCALILTAALFLGISHIVHQLSPEADFSNSFKTYGHMISGIIARFRDGSVFTDNLRAFAGYFLRRDFGYWDSSFLGITAALSFAGLLLLRLTQKWPSKALSKIILATVVIFLVKAFFLPHNSGVNLAVMPEGTKFASLLFFSYYYTYVDAALFGILFGVLWSAFSLLDKRFLLSLILITLIAVSNAAHLKNGPSQILNYINWTAGRKTIARRVLGIADAERALGKEARPIYLSYPTKDEEVFRDMYARQTPDKFYPIFILNLYLKQLEDRDLLISTGNIAGGQGGPQDNWRFAKTFLDVPTHTIIDLTTLRPAGRKKTTAWRIYGRGGWDETIMPRGSSRMILFLKGRGRLGVKINDRVFWAQQEYGYSYQVFEFPLPPEGQSPITASFAVFPANPQHEITVMGPFVPQ